MKLRPPGRCSRAAARRTSRLEGARNASTPALKRRADVQGRSRAHTEKHTHSCKQSHLARAFKTAKSQEFGRARLHACSRGRVRRRRVSAQGTRRVHNRAQTTACWRARALECARVCVS
eukprot:6208587-Pleurochrysis_carterae.AAC.1